MRFGPDQPVSCGVLRAGWLSDPDGAVSSGFESRLTLQLPDSLGEPVLIADVSPAADGSGRLTIAANGAIVADRTILGRTRLYARLSRAGAEGVDLVFFHPDGGRAASQAHPLDELGAGTILHRIGIAMAGPEAWYGYADLDALIAALNAGGPASGAHDLGLPGSGGQARRHELSGPMPVLPHGTRPAAIRTCHDTILFADPGGGRLRHGPAAEVPRNLVMFLGSGEVHLVRTGGEGETFGVRLRPEGTYAAAVPAGHLSIEGFAPVLEAIATGDPSGRTFALRGAGLFVCAEADGEVTLSRPTPGPWEQFRALSAPG